MTRSFKKTPAGGNTCSDSEKQDKQLWYRSLRRKVKQLPAQELETAPNVKEVSDPWLMDKDGKAHYSKKAIQNHPGLIRK